ncbi:cell division regulator GpsB [Caryophanon tenue]|uniref:Cell cycle protein GpsB n=1 Tax=Caryophanon tenue TaxID=33978 RepID=A0A1C0Y579_9BACL|nr:cell division regulator GpsB [Caryophanon tenue]OCS82337.1 hypothetical protein A6M13_07850 [Caryophanon tenue]
MNLHLDAKTIYEKEFKSGLRGYNQDDVDNFLDKVIEDYREFEKVHDTVKNLQEENRRLMQEMAQLRQELQRAKQHVQPERPVQKPAPVQHSASGTTYFDILQRLSNLEKHVFGSRLDRE